MDYFVHNLVWRFVRIVAKHEPGGSAAASFRKDQVDSIDIGDEDHINGMVLCDAVGVCRQVV